MSSIASLVKINYENGFVLLFSSDFKITKLSEISEIHLVREKLICYIEESQDEQTHRKFVCLLDMLNSARNSFVKDQESICLKSLLWTR